MKAGVPGSGMNWRFSHDRTEPNPLNDRQCQKSCTVCSKSPVGGERFLTCDASSSPRYLRIGTVRRIGNDLRVLDASDYLHPATAFLALLYPEAAPSIAKTRFSRCALRRRFDLHATSAAGPSLLVQAPQFTVDDAVWQARWIQIRELMDKAFGCIRHRDLGITVILI
jgi:hypothetical protein